MKLGMVISTKTGQKVLAVQQQKDNELIIRDTGKKPLRTRLKGGVGDRFNYITMENYGQGEIYPVPKRRK